MASRVAGKIKLQSVDELLGVPEIAGTQEIEIERIHAFPNHPFKVLDDEKMDTLVDSIRENGILNPVIVRPDQSGNYEMISGHRRLHAAKIVGLKKVPAIVKEMSDDEAIIKMVDANIQREEILPSEKAFAYKMKLDALKRTAGRPTKENACHNGTHLRSDQELALQVGDSARSIQRYIRLTELIPELLDYVDNKKIGLVMAVDLSYLDEQVQKWVYEYFKENGFLKPVQVEALKNYPNLSNVTQFSVISIMNDALPKKSKESKLSFSAKKLDKYFPPQYSTKERESIIIQLSKDAIEALNSKEIIMIFPSQKKNNRTVRVLKTPKTDSSVRKVFIPKSVAQCLIDLKADQDEIKEVLGNEYQDYNLVMATTFGLPIGDSYLRTKMQEIIDELGLPDVVFHSLRHTSVTYKLKLSGGDIKAVQGDSGHAQADMVTEVYGHILDEDRRKNAELMENAFYNKENLNPQMKEQDEGSSTITVPDGVDAELLMKVLGNPEMTALLTSLAKTMR